MSERDVTNVPDDYTAKLMAEVARLEAKSDGLLKELEAEHALAEMLGLWLDDTKAENAKLRELVSFVLRFETMTDGCGDTCPYVCLNCKNECYFRKVAGELRIEVGA